VVVSPSGVALKAITNSLIFSVSARLTKEAIFNSSGPNSSGNIGDGIYISCKPTGSSEDEIPVEYVKNISYDFSNIYQNPIFYLIIQIIIGIIVTLSVFYFFNYIYSFITKDINLKTSYF
jgi:hypothetical protein